MAVIWQLSILNFPNKTLIRGVITEKLPYNSEERYNTVFHSLRILRSYFIKTETDKAFTLHTRNTSYDMQTDSKGSFEVWLQESYDPKWIFRLKSSGQVLNVNKHYPIVFNCQGFKLGVISDIDDTLIMSYTSNVWKRVSTLLFRKPQHRKPIGFTKQLLNHLKNYPTGFFYVSKSESNLFGLLSNFLMYNSFPKGTLFLTPYLRFKELFKTKKGWNFKLNTIRLLLKNNLCEHYILFGDDTQQDLDIYHEVVLENKGKIDHIFIRQTRKSVSSRHQSLIQKLNKQGISVQFFQENDIPDLMPYSKYSSI